MEARTVAIIIGVILWIGAAFLAYWLIKTDKGGWA